MLTKSLHTITAAVNVARFLLEQPREWHGNELPRFALSVLGYDYTEAEFNQAAQTDATLQKIVAGCAKVLQS